MAKNPAQILHEFGTSVWYDNISREILLNGELKRMIDEWGVRGLTSNPAIFDNALKASAYDPLITELASKGLSVDQIFEELAIGDIAEAADLLRPLYEESLGEDGFASIEVSPLLARDAEGTFTEAKRLFERLDRPNVMIKIPGTPEGLPAVRKALEAGINVNVTLLFSVKNYVDVAKTYCDALSARVSRGEPVDRIRSVASFFVSRVDSIIDSHLEKIAAEKVTLKDKALSLRGKFGIANSKLAYREFLRIFSAPEFLELRKAGARVQRPLWASTSTKNPNYRDVIYVEELIGPNTVNTIPHNTLEAFVNHGELAETLTRGVDRAQALAQELVSVGINIDALMDKLQVEGVEKFADSFHSLRKTLSTKVSG